MKALPKFIVVIDPKKEHIAVKEAKTIKIPIVALAGSDSNLFDVDMAIPGNDASRQTISFVLEEMVKSYLKGKDEKDKEQMLNDKSNPSE